LQCCERRCPTGFAGALHSKSGVRGRIGILVCLLAFAVQLLVPVVHIWEVAAERATIAPKVAPLPSLPGGVQHAAALLAADDPPQRAPHNAALCPVCQALLRVRDYVVGQSCRAGVSAPGAWIVAVPVYHPLSLHLSASAPRAPPSLS
jgi:hypothetical protein